MTRVPVRWRLAWFALTVVGCLSRSYDATAEHKHGAGKSSEPAKGDHVKGGGAAGGHHKGMPPGTVSGPGKLPSTPVHAPAMNVPKLPAAPPPQGKKTQPEPQAASNAQLKQAPQVLQATQGILQGADHDYGGDRARAVRGVGNAEKQLRLALGLSNPAAAPAAANSRKMPEPQALSNAQLRQAIPVLQQAIESLKKADHDYTGHRTQTVHDLEHAVMQLQSALDFQTSSQQSPVKKYTSRTGVRVRQYSDSPYPWRTDGGPRDEFERAALRRLRRSKGQETVHEFTEIGGQRVVRFAQARLMKRTCVECHNTHPQSPRKDWREGDVRGVLVIIRPLGKEGARVSEALSLALLFSAVVSGLLLGGSLLVVWTDRRRTRAAA